MLCATVGRGSASARPSSTRKWKEPRLAALRDDIAAELVSAFDPALPFGLRFTMTKAPFGSDVSGYLDGAAGVALALDSYAVGGTPADWDMPLLLA